jgi:hypothetical protein
VAEEPGETPVTEEPADFAVAEAVGALAAPGPADGFPDAARV